MLTVKSLLETKPGWNTSYLENTLYDRLEDTRATKR